MTNMINPGDPRAADVLGKLQKLLVTIADAPADAPRSNAALARSLNINEATLWRHGRANADVKALADQIVRTGKSGKLWDGESEHEERTADEAAPLALTTEDVDPLTTLPDEELRRRASRELMKARAACQRLLGRANPQRLHLSDLPRTLFALEKSLAEARGAGNNLRPLVDEWLRRSVRDVAEDGRPDLELDLE